MRYEANLSREAAKNLDRLDRATPARIHERLDQLRENPRDPRISKQLKGVLGLRSSRVGGWRILYAVNDEAKLIFIVAIRPRGEAYRDL